MDEQQGLSGVDLDILVPDPNAIKAVLVNEPIAAWPGAADSIVLSATSRTDGSIVQQGCNNGEPDIIWERVLPIDGDWSEWEQIAPLPLDPETTILTTETQP